MGRDGWKEVTLKDIAKWGSGGTPKSGNKSYYGGDIPWLIIGDMNDSYIFESAKKITQLGLENSSAKIVPANSVLIAMYGSIGKLGINKLPVTTNQAIAFTRELKPEIYNLYLFYYLLYSRPRLINLGKGGTQQNISQTVLKKFPFTYPPLPEQRAIVTMLELLLGELDRSVLELEVALGKLGIYRASVLKEGFLGRLTGVGKAAQVKMGSLGDYIEKPKYGTSQKCTKEVIGEAVLRILNLKIALLTQRS